MVQSNAVMFGWNRAVSGRETQAAELFAHAVNYFDKLKTSAKIETYEPVFLGYHGGDLNGFFLVKGTHAQLEAMRASDEFVDLTVRAGHALEQVGVIEAYTGPEIPNVMGRWTKLIPHR